MQFYSENIKPNLTKMCDFLYGFCKSREWKLILRNNVLFTSKNYYEPLSVEGHVGSAHGGVEKTMQYLTDSYQSDMKSDILRFILFYCTFLVMTNI